MSALTRNIPIKFHSFSTLVPCNKSLCSIFIQNNLSPSWNNSLPFISSQHAEGIFPAEWDSSCCFTESEWPFNDLSVAPPFPSGVGITLMIAYRWRIDGELSVRGAGGLGFDPVLPVPRAVGPPASTRSGDWLLVSRSLEEEKELSCKWVTVTRWREEYEKMMVILMTTNCKITQSPEAPLTSWRPCIPCDTFRDLRRPLVYRKSEIPSSTVRITGILRHYGNHRTPTVWTVLTFYTSASVDYIVSLPFHHN